MGGGGSHQYHADNEMWEATFRKLGLSVEDVTRLFNIFHKIDKDHNTTVEVIEFLGFLNLDRSPFALKAFSVMDLDRSGSINFFEFAVSTWNYCTLNKTTLMVFAFDLYDSDASGHICRAEAEGMCKELWGGEWEKNENAVEVLKMLTVVGGEDGEGYDIEMSIEDFCDFARTHQTLLFPAFKLQSSLRSAILGDKFWKEATLVREATYDSTDEQRALIDLLRATQQSEAVRYLCHDLWEKDRKGKAIELAAKAAGKGHKKKKKAKNMTDLDAVQKVTAKIREKVDKKRDQRAERNPGDDASREKALLAEYDGHAAPGEETTAAAESASEKIRGGGGVPILAKPEIGVTHMKGALAKRMATKQQEEAVAVPASTNMAVDAETGLREDLVALGVRFLCGPNNSERDVSELLVFLEGKGLTPDEVVESLTRAGRW
mmetsp:Transcript_31217/g.82690  ORF Transcript_31217/g.82690 Transcript_31217/m.82690 type:complete len:433 (+) Transcript_31217:191-1489(+)